MLIEQIQTHQFVSEILQTNPRRIEVYLPPNYFTEPERRFPVLYMQDGQNLFNPQTSFGGVAWQVDETAQKLIFENKIEPLIIVGIYNTGDARFEEYTPTKSTRGRGGQALLYGQMLTQELKPFIDAQYRTLPQQEFTGIGGSSLGALVSLFLGFKQPDVFGRLAIMSPSIWWDKNVMTREIIEYEGKPPLRIWLDIGKLEGSRIKSQVRLLRGALLEKGWRADVDLGYLEIPDGRHDENSWSLRFDKVLRYLFPPASEKQNNPYRL
ncbi:MAG: alpha/beta hydrolase [Pyrinomonadaceae bacterium]|nr:alpha/beta hydrolase [Pyrinomonadaceae bacterium]